MNTAVQSTVTFIETTGKYAPIAVRLHTIRQKNSIAVLRILSKPSVVIILGQFESALMSSPLLLKEHLELCGIEMSYKEVRNLFCFLERLLRKIEKEPLLKRPA